MLFLVLLSKERTLSVALKRESRLCGISISRAIASNSSTEALGSVISFAFVVYSHHKHSKYLGRELNHGPVASVISVFLATALIRAFQMPLLRGLPSLATTETYAI